MLTLLSMDLNQEGGGIRLAQGITAITALLALDVLIVLGIVLAVRAVF